MTVAAQLSLFDPPAANAHAADPLERALAELVAEPGMSDAELEAVVADALEQLAPPPGPTACRCLPAGAELDEPRCWRCGREVTT